MPFLLLLWPLLILIIGITVIGLLIGSLLVVIKFAIPLFIIWLIYRAIVGPRQHHAHHQRYDWQSTTRTSSRHTDSRDRKEARDVKVDDDDWSDF